MLEKQPGSRLGLLAQATQPSQVSCRVDITIDIITIITIITMIGITIIISSSSSVNCEVRHYEYTFIRYYSCVTPTHWRRMNTILTDIRALSTISSTFTELVRRGAHIDKIIDGEKFIN